MTKNMVAAAEKIFSVTKTMVTGMEKTFSLTKTMVVATEKIFSFANTMVSRTETVVSVPQKILSDVETMVFETGTLVWEMKTVGKTGKKTGDADRFCMGAAHEDSSGSRYQQKPVSVPGNQSRHVHLQYLRAAEFPRVSSLLLKKGSIPGQTSSRPM